MFTEKRPLVAHVKNSEFLKVFKQKLQKVTVGTAPKKTW